MTTSERIKKRRKELGLSLQDVADALGVNKSTVLRYETKEIEKLPVDVIAPLADVLKVSQEYLMGWEDPKPVQPKLQLVKIPLYSSICCGNGGFCDDEIIDYISLPPEKMNPHKSYFAQTAKGESMVNAGIHPGDILVFEKTSSIQNGEIGCFCIDDNEAMCKRYRLKKDENGHIKQIILVPANDDVVAYPPIPIDVENQHFRCIGKLVFCIVDMQGK